MKAATGKIIIAVALVAIGASVALARPAGAALESKRIYALRVGECSNWYTGPSIAVEPPRMWANYDTTGRSGQKVAWKSRLFRRNDDGTWGLMDQRAWEVSGARNQRPRNSDPGNLSTYVLGAYIFTGAEQGNSAFQFNNNTTYTIQYTGTYRIAIDMYWYKNRYSRARQFSKWLPLHIELSGDSPLVLDCVVNS